MSLFRSFLFAPGNHPRRIEKALTLDADAVILDLEDACPLAEKVRSRATVACRSAGRTDFIGPVTGSNARRRSALNLTGQVLASTIDAVKALQKGSPAVRIVQAALNYLGPMTERPTFYPAVAGRTNLVMDPRVVPITDARTLAALPSLEREGFTLAEQPTKVSDFRDVDQVHDRYLEEIAALVQQLSGADEVRASPGPIVRFVDRANASWAANTAPAARFVHGDYTDTSAREHFLPQVAKAEEVLSRYRRIVVYQTWRALSDPPQDVPLAITDVRSVSRDDLITADTILGEVYGGKPQSFEYSMCRYNPAHRWYYFSQMRIDEVLVFKGYDFDVTRPARLPHTAFDDPSAPPGCAPRASVEARAFAFFA